VARGINIGLQTRLYFEDEAEANAQDPILSRIEPRARAQTLVARRTAPGQYRFDIHLQGPLETVFLDI
jgi:protocatechuate 3,4-dioxygenase alpha subunit